MTSLAVHLQTNAEIAIIPTDTVYGVAARVGDPEAVARLYKLKHRDKKPGTLIAASIEQLVALGIKKEQLDVVKKFWPGAVSVIMPVGENLFYIHQGVGSLAVRIPNDKWLLELLKNTGPLLTSSANQPGEPPATTIDQARAYFGNQVSWYEDGGIVNRKPSTVIKVMGSTIEVIRPGAVTFGEQKS